MTFLSIVLLSIVEGITEFLPVSSTAHMGITSKIMGIPDSASLFTFIIAIQVGAIIAGLIFLLKKIKITKKVFTLAVVSFIPTGIIGLLAYPYIKIFLFNNILVIAFALLIGGIIILVVDKKDAEESLQDFTRVELSYKHAFLLGLVQTLAFIPGVSRSGSLIIGGRLLKYKRSSIVIFTFLLGLPTLMAATAYDLYKSQDILTKNLGLEILLGAVVSGIVAYAVCKWFLHYITNHTFKIFGWYRIIVGVVILAFIYFS